MAKIDFLEAKTLNKYLILSEEKPVTWETISVLARIVDMVWHFDRGMINKTITAISLSGSHLDVIACIAVILKHE